MAFDVLRNPDDVAAGAETAPFRMIDEDDADVRIVTPLDQRVCHVAHHLPIEAVQRTRAVEPQASGEPFLVGQHVLLGRRHRIHHGIIA